jgi:hypothetical protein
MTMKAESEAPGRPAIGVILLDYEGYSGIEAACSPDDEAGLGWMPPGHLENPGSWGCSTIYRIAVGCTPEASAEATPDAAKGVREAAQALDGRVDLITADCAYTWFVHDGLQGIGTPVVTSSLALLDLARSMGEEVAIVASSGEVLGSLMGTPPAGVRIVGLDTKDEWARYQVYSVDTEPSLDRGLMGAQLLERLEEDFAEQGEPDVMLLECTGLPQFRRVIRTRYAGPIIDISSFAHYLLGVPQRDEAFLPVEDVGVTAGRSG